MTGENSLPIETNGGAALIIDWSVVLSTQVNRMVHPMLWFWALGSLKSKSHLTLTFHVTSLGLDLFPNSWVFSRKYVAWLSRKLEDSANRNNLELLRREHWSWSTVFQFSVGRVHWSIHILLPLVCAFLVHE